MSYSRLHNSRVQAQHLLDLVTWFLLFRRSQLSGKTFLLDGSAYSYFVHPYNHTWRNERAVELPLFIDALRHAAGARVLEVGNVLSHYVHSAHDVVDLYETARNPRLQRVDIMDFRPSQLYDLVLSISTMEHVGQDEHPRRPEKAVEALHRIRQLLRPNGMALLSVPVGHNLALDDYLRLNRDSCFDARALKRVSADNLWEQTDIENAWDFRYGSPYEAANAILILKISGAPD